jgi:uncharacterized protein (DUF433 family)
MKSRVLSDPAINHGAPVIRGTRVPAKVLAGSVAGGMKIEDIQREYDVTAEDIAAAVQFVKRRKRLRFWIALAVVLVALEAVTRLWPSVDMTLRR